MKKFLSMLLALSVVFTYTFGAVGSVYAAESEAQSKMKTDLEAAVKVATKALDNAMAVITSEKTDKDGFVDLGGISPAASKGYYTPEGLKAIGDKIIADFADKAEEAIRGQGTAAYSSTWLAGVNTANYFYDDAQGTLDFAAIDTTSEWSTILTKVECEATTVNNIKAAAQQLQAPLSYAAYKAAIEKIDSSKYSEEAEKYPLNDVYLSTIKLNGTNLQNCQNLLMLMKKQCQVRHMLTQLRTV